MACIKRQRSRPAFMRVLAADAESSARGPQTTNRSLLDRCWLSYHGYARWVCRAANACATRLHLADVPTTDQVVQQSRILCQDYIYSRLRKQSMLSPRTEIKGSGSRPSDVSLEIQVLGGELERLYPDLYKGVSKQLNITMTSPLVVRKTMLSVADHMYKSGHITWGKVVSLFALANAFAMDCVQQGHPEFVTDVTDMFAKIVYKHLAHWIVRQGGWIDVIRAFRTSKDAPVVWTLSLLGAAVGFACTVLATVDI